MYLLVDVGGTYTKLGISKDGKTLEDFQKVESEQDYLEGLKLINSYKEKHSDLEFKSVVVGLPGRLDRHKQLMIHGNLTQWVGKNIKSDLEKTLSLPVFLENDAALGGLGEAVYGAGQGFPIVGFLTISTGVGGVKIVSGEIDENSLGFEPGFQYVGEKQLKDYISGQALEKLYQKKPEQITDVAIWDKVAHYLAIGINNIVDLWSPDVVVLGGSIMKSVTVESVQLNLDKLAKGEFKFPPVLASKLGDQNGLYGGIVYLRDGY